MTKPFPELLPALKKGNVDIVMSGMSPPRAPSPRGRYHLTGVDTIRWLTSRGASYTPSLLLNEITPADAGLVRTHACISSGEGE